MDRIMGKTWEEIQAMQQGTYKPQTVVNKPGDYGCDPIGDGTYRMVPSGDIVDATERDRRLGF